tara:strand:+ start:1270 stop:1992 length:723 start_codon:yes stop_codon:yes gene_type:complete
MKDILNSHSVAALKKEISKTNIKGYSKMKKGEIVDLMSKNASKFGHIKMAEKKSRVKAKPAEAKQKASPAKASPAKASPAKASPAKASGKYPLELNFFGTTIGKFYSGDSMSQQDTAFNKTVSRLMTPAREAGMSLKKRKLIREKLEDVANDAVYYDKYKTMKSFVSAIRKETPSYVKTWKHYWETEMGEELFYQKDQKDLVKSPKKPKKKIIKKQATKEERKEGLRKGLMKATGQYVSK